MNLVMGATGLLGSALMKLPRMEASILRLEDEEYYLIGYEVAFLCAGTRGFRKNEGNAKAFRADVDGNIRLAKHLLRQGTFVVFVSTEGVEWSNSAYCRNRLLVEMALIMQPNVGIFRPSKFTPETVDSCALACYRVGHERIEGVTRWDSDGLA